MTSIKKLLVLFCFLYSVSSKPSADNHESESQVSQLEENLRNLETSYEQNKTKIKEQIKDIELETWKYNTTFENFTQTLETKASELKQEELNKRRKILQIEFEEIVNKIFENGQELLEASKVLDKAKTECVWEDVVEEECTEKVNKHQRYIESGNEALKIFIAKLVDKQNEIEEHEKIRQKSFDELLKFAKDFMESEKEIVEKVKKLGQDFIQKQYELEALEESYKRRENEMKNGGA